MNEPAPTEQDTLDRPATTGAATPAVPDLDLIEADLDGVERALARLADGTYWSDEVTGAPLDETFLADHPTARRAPS